MTERDQPGPPDEDDEDDEAADQADAGAAVADSDAGANGVNETADNADPSGEADADHESGLTATDLTGQAEPESEGTPAAEPDAITQTESTAAFVLGALTPADAAATARKIAGSPALRSEVALLLPVADILMNIFQTQPTPGPGDTAIAVPAERPSGPRQAPTAAAVAPRRSAPGGGEAVAHRRAPALAGLSLSNVVMAVLALGAAIGILWALALTDRLASRDDEIAALKRQVGQLRQAVNASTFVLSPTENAEEGARGTVFYSLADQTVLIDVSGLPELEEDTVYQVWFQRSGSDAWEPGPTFRVNPQGEAVQRLAGETPTFNRIAVSQEPAQTSPEPTGPFLLQGTLSGGNG